MNIDDHPKTALILHVCCAPCATSVVERLRPEYRVVPYFSNSNIHPEEEYRLRLREMERLSPEMSLDLFRDEYDPDRWFAEVRGLEHEPEGGARCERCFRLRLDRTAQFALAQGIDTFTTTLTVSPHKRADVIHRIGAEVAARHSLRFLPEDFKKRDGFRRSGELSREYGLYRQNYCGCLYSRRKPKDAMTR